MDARNAIQRIVAIVIVTAGVMETSPSVYAGPAHIYTYGGGDFNLPIPAIPGDTKGWMDDAIIDVPDHFTIADLDVRISITHTSAFDLQIYLESPAGPKLCLIMYDITEFFKGKNYFQTIFDDEAEISIEEGEPPFTGRFRPRSPAQLSVFDGQNTFGSWKLQIYDARFYDTGKLDSFELIITIPEPATAILLLLGAGLATPFRPRQRW